MRLHYPRLRRARQRSRTSTSARSRRCWWRPRARGATTSRRRCVEEYGEERGDALFRRYRDAFPDRATGPTGCRARRSPTSPASRSWTSATTCRCASTARSRRATGRAAGEGLPPRARRSPCPTCCRCSRTWACRSPTSAPTRSLRATARPSGSTTSASPTRATIELEAGPVRDAFQEAFIRSGAGDTESDGYNRLVLRARLTSREATVLRAIGRYLRQAGTTFSDRYVELALVGAPGRGAAARRPVPSPASTPRSADAERAADALVERIEQEIDAVESLDQDRILRNFLDVVRAMLRTNFFQRDCRRIAQAATSRSSSTPTQLPLAAPPAPALRDLRLLAAHRGRAPARREGRARRDPLVGPARGLPHRGARADEGADGQERGDRAGRREGRLRGQAPAGGRRPRGAARRGRGLLPHLHQRPARPDRQHRRRRDRRRRPTSCATTRTTPTWSSRPTRARPTLLGRRQRGRDATTASGSATRSPRAARAATTTSRWASPRAARGSPSSATSASWATTSRTKDFTVVGVGDMSGDVFGNGMLLSTHIRLVAAFDHRHVFIDPDPDAERSFEERKRLFELPRSSWDDYDRELISEGRRRLLAHRPSRSRSRPRCARRSTCDGEALPPNELIRALLCAPRRPALERRHRHLRQGQHGDARRRRRQGQRRACA